MDQLALKSVPARVSPPSESWMKGVCDTMEKKILTIMVALMLVAAIVVAFVMIAAGGIRTEGGFTRLFNELENPNPTVTYDQYLEFPADWKVQDIKTVSDMIQDMYPRGEELSGGITVYTVRMFFVYEDDKWADPDYGTLFNVPSTEHSGEYIQVNHGLFWVDVSSTENLAESYNIGDVIEIQTVLVANDDNDGELSFGDWLLTS